jgi:hypothetical protein
MRYIGSRTASAILMSALMITSFVPLHLVSAQGAPVVMVQSPVQAIGNVTITGVAVECASGQPARRVAVYDGMRDDAPYIADVSMDTVRNLNTVCGSVSGSGQIGFTLIYDTNRLADGAHDLVFVAEFPNGASASATAQLFVGGGIMPVDVPPMD